MEEGERVEFRERNSRQTIWQSDGGSRRIAKIGGLNASETRRELMGWREHLEQLKVREELQIVKQSTF